MQEITNSTLKLGLDALVEENKGKLIPLRKGAVALGSVSNFVFGMNRGYQGKIMNHFWRRRDNLPSTPFVRWNEERNIKLGSTHFDGEDIDIKFARGELEIDAIYVNLHTRDVSQGYVFIPEVGLYLHEESKYVEDRLLLFPQ